MIQKHFDKNNLHHAYLIEGEKEEIISELFEFIESIGINTKNNPDFIHISQDSFKIDDAKNLKSQSNEKAISYNLSNGQMGKKVFVISINSFLSDAQNTLLKMFEEPIENTMFFLIIPDTAIMLPTLLSRFYLIKTKNYLNNEIKQAEEFLSMTLNNRILFIKELVSKKDDDEESSFENIKINSNRSIAIKFLNALELVLHKKYLPKAETGGNFDYFHHIFKVRKYLSEPGSSTKSLMESVALLIPKL